MNDWHRKMHHTHVNGDVMRFLRRHAGERFLLAEIAERTAHDEQAVRGVLHSRYHDARYGLHREQLETKGRPYRWWIGNTAEFAVNESERAIAKFMAKRRIAAKPSEIAAGAQVELAAAVEVLTRWSGDGTAVRCELPLRAEPDRFEYRLSHVVEIQHGRSHARKSIVDLDEKEAVSWPFEIARFSSFEGPPPVPFRRASRPEPLREDHRCGEGLARNEAAPPSPAPDPSGAQS